MIKFFRKIRQNLLSEGKTGKYLKYAIGEIVLVVIGILIALQINNWNESNKRKDLEIQTLYNLRESLNKDSKNIERALSFYANFKISVDLILNHMKADLPYQDSLKYHFGNTNNFWLMTINQSVFETLKSNDLNLISDDSLRQNIVDLYTWGNEGFKKGQELYRGILEQASINIFNTRFDEFWRSNYEEFLESNTYDNIDYSPTRIIPEMIPNDYESLKNDKEYIYYLKSLKNRFYWHIEIEGISMHNQIAKTLELIEKQLETQL